MSQSNIHRNYEHNRGRGGWGVDGDKGASGEGDAPSGDDYDDDVDSHDEVKVFSLWLFLGAA